MKAKIKLIIGIVLAVVILAVGLTVTLVVTGNLERDQQQVVRSASQIETAMSTDLGGKTIVLAEDITVEGDLEMSRLADLDLNGHTLTVTGAFSVESDSKAEIEIKSTDGDKAVSGGTIDAGSVDINVPNAHVEWSGDVRLGSDGTFTVLTSGDSFIFTGRFLTSGSNTGTTAAGDAAITALGGRVEIASQTANVEYKVNIPSTASDVRVDSGVPSTSSVEVITSKSVTVSGTVAVTVSEGASGVAITADSGSSLTVTGSAASVNAPSSSVTVAENSTVGSITAGDVTNNGTVSGSITASGDVVNNGSVTGDVTAGGSVTGDGDIGGNVEAGDVTVVEIPTLTSNATYNGEAQTFTVAATDYYDAVTVTGTDADTYTGTLSLSDKVNTKWSDGTTADKTVTLTIAPKSVAVVWSNTSLTYTGSTQAPTATADTGITGETLTLTVAGQQTNAGTYTATASTTNGNYTLTNATTSFTIAPMEITVPTLTKTVAYNGAEQTFTIAATDYYAAVTVRGTNADVYTETLALRDKANTVWADGTTADKTVTLTITRGTIDVGTAEELTEALSDSGYSTIRLTADIEYTNLAAFNTAVQAANGSLTIDLNDNTLTLTANGTTITAQNGFSLTITNGELVANNNTYTDTCFSAETDSSVTFEDLTVTSTGSVLFPRGDAAEVNIINCDITTTGVYVVGTNAGSEENYGVVINISGSTLTAERSDGDTCVVMINVAGELNISDTEIYGQRQGVMVRAGTATLTNVDITVDLKCTFGTDRDTRPFAATTDGGWNTGNEVSYGALVVGNNTASTYNANAVVTMTGGSLTCTTTIDELKNHTNAIYALRIGGSNNTTSVTLSGTTVSGQVINYNNTATITGLPADMTVITALVSRADELEKALVNNAYIVLVDDIKADVVIPEDTTVTLDLNGYTLTNESDHTIINNGTLTVIDSSETKTGVVDNVTHAKAALYNEVGATATLNGGEFTRSKENGSSSTESGGNSYYAILNHGTMTINAGTKVTQNGHYSSLLENGWYDGSENTDETASVLTINGGEFTGGLNTIKNDDWGVLTINDGEFSNMTQSVVLNWNVAEINGGTFTVSEDAEQFAFILNGYINDTMDRGVLTVSADVTFNGSASIFAQMGGSKNAGTITVNSEEHLNAALEVSSVTIILGTDMTVNAVIEKGVTVTLDLNGHTLTSDVTGKATVHNYGDVTIVGNGLITRGTNTKWYVIVNEGTMTLDGDFTVKNDNTSDSSSVIINNYDCDSAAPAQLTINDGTYYSASSNAVKNDEYGVLTINGGTFETSIATHVAVQNWATMTINGGEFTGPGQAVSVMAYEDQTNTTTITGGTFGTPTSVYLRNGYVELPNYNCAKGTINLTITGGTFNGILTTHASDTLLATDKIDLSGFDGKVVIYANSESSLKAAVAIDNASVELSGDITLTEVLNIDNTVVLNLNDHTIKVEIPNVSVENGAVAIRANEGGNLTINGNGTIDARPPEGEEYANNDYLVAVGAMRNGGYITINEGVTIIVDTPRESCVYVMNGGIVTINGGTFINECTDDYAYGGGAPLTLNVSNSAQVTDIVVYGGTFRGRNPALGDDNLGGNFVADGYKVVERTDGTYEVVAEEAEVTGDDIVAVYYYDNGVASKAEVYAASGLTNAIGGGYSDIVLMNDITTADRLTISSAESDVDLTIDLGGYTLTSTESGGYVFLILGCDTSNAYTPYKYSIDLTIKNGEIITSVDQSYAVDIRSKSDNVKVSLSDLKMTAVWGGMYSNGIGSGAVVTAENCEFIGTGDASVGAYLPANNTYTFTDCSFSGDDGIYIKSGTYTFNNCTFAASGEYAEPEYNGNGAPSVGAAMAIDSCQGYQNPIVVTVNGGTFSSVNGYGIMEYITERTEGMEPYATVTLKGDITFGECGKGEIYSQNNLVAIEYEVSSVDDLVALNNYQSVMLNGAVMNVTLTQDIDLADGNFTTEDFTLIDEYAGYALIPHFRGVFNGGNHTIISGLSNLNAIIGIMYGESEIRDLTVKLTNPERITRVVAEYGCLYESNGEGSIIYTSDDSIEYKFTNVDYVTADNAYYNIGDSGNRALYYNDTNYAYYYNSATGKYSSIWVGNIRTSDDSPIPANIVLTGCDVTGNFMGGNHASGAAVFLAGQIGTAVDVTITDSSFTGNLVGDNIGIVFANSSGVLNVRLTDEDEDGNYVWDDGINLDIEVNGTISTWKKSTGDNGSGYIFGNNATEGPATDITLVGGEGKISTATDITLTVDDNSQFVVSGITEEMSSLTLQLQLGTLTCYESEGGIRVTEASDYVVLLSLPSESVSGGSLATDIYRMYPRTLEQAIADGIVSDSEDIEWQTSADGKQYTIVADGDSRYIVVNANANASYYYAFEESATGVLSRATLYAYSDSGIPLASVSYR